MNALHCTVTMAFLACASGLAYADGERQALSLPPAKEVMDQVRATKRLPLTGLAIVETVDGKTMLVSDNGRIAIIGGRWVDLWEGKEFSGIADSSSLDKVNLPRMGIDVAEFSPFVIGNGKKTVVAFVDPLCDECRLLVKEMKALSKEYTFRVVLLPVKGQASGLAARRIHCSPDRGLAQTAFENNAISTLPEAPNNCDVTAIQKALIASSVVGIKKTPYLIKPDGTAITTIERGQGLAELLATR